MPMRKRGGKVSSADHRGKTGIGTRTPIQHTDNKDDTQNIGRKKPITYAKGGKVDPIKRGGEEQYSKASHVEAEGDVGAKGRKQYTDGWNEHTHPTTSRQHTATGGPIYANGKAGAQMGPHEEAGGRSGLGRLEKAAHAKAKKMAKPVLGGGPTARL